jgi:hypothetical protein
MKGVLKNYRIKAPVSNRERLEPPAPAGGRRSRSSEPQLVRRPVGWGLLAAALLRSSRWPR